MLESSQRKWDLRFIELAQLVSTWSKDPSTQTGAVLVSPNREVISVGYNGFARGVDDSAERYADRIGWKYPMVVHCEVNAMIVADRHRLKGSCLYTWPFMSCSRCAAQMIQAGVTRICTKEAEHVDVTAANDPNRWERDFFLARTQFEESGVQMVFYPKEAFDAGTGVSSTSRIV